MRDLPSPLLLEACARRDLAAEAELFRRYASRLVALARPRLSRTLAARVDAEDVAMSAWRSFFTLVHEGRVAVGEGGLWPLLARVTLHKLARSVRRHSAARRSAGREEARDDLPSLKPGPAEAAALLDELRSALDPLPTIQRRMVELRLEGHDAEEVALRVGRSSRTVRRTLAALEEELTRRLEGLPEPQGEMGYADVVLLKQIGMGGMGKVYRARHRHGGEELAVKLLRKPLRAHTLAASRFVEEARILSRLRHLNIIAIRGVGSLPDGGLFLAMELADGDLSERGAAPEQILRWVAQAADGLHHAHEAGVVHCDLKPSNILLCGDVAKVADFGLAHLRGGTSGFQAPEQREESTGPLTPRTDVFGLGAVLCALLGDDMPAACRAFLSPTPEDRPDSAAEAARIVRAVG